MKHCIYFIWAFSIVYPLGCCAADYDIDDKGDIPADITMHRERRDIVTENFLETPDNIHCTTPINKFYEVNEKFLKLIDRFHYDSDLKFYYALFLINYNKTIEGIKVLAQAIESGIVMDVATGTLSQIFMEQLKNLSIEGESPKKYIDNLKEWLWPSAPPQRISYSRGIRNFSDAGIEKFNKQADHEIRENMASLLDLLKDLQEPIIYDATLGILGTALEDLGHKDTLDRLIIQLYLNDKNKEQSPPRLKIIYASGHLMRHKKYLDAISLYESVLKSRLDANHPYSLDPDNPYQTVQAYNALACCYLATEVKLVKSADKEELNFEYSQEGRIRLERGITLLENALCLDSLSLTTYQNLAHCQFVLGDYALASINIKKILDKTDQELAAFKRERSYLQNIYELILQKSGRSDELTSILLEKQRKIIDKHKKTVALIKEDQAQHQQEVEARRQKRQDAQQQPPHQPIKQVISGSSYMAESATLSEMEKGGAASSKKQKGKARKTLQQSAPVAPIVAPPAETKKEQSLNYIKNLTESSSVKKTFDKLFSKYVTGQDEKISLNEISHFFKALDQDFDPSKGKGSHKKATLNFQNQGIDMEEQMLILTNTTYLKPEQIKDIRLAFVQARIVPDNGEIIQKLKEEGVL